MIIQVRGTSGSGKSTVVKAVMDSFELGFTPVHREGRKQPLYYSRGKLAVLGHYETACGGCDTIGSARQVFELIGELQEKYPIILCEGLLLSEDVKWSSQLDGLRVIYLTTEAERCVKQIQDRRLQVGNHKPFNPTNTLNRVDVIERSRTKLIHVGKVCRRTSPDQAVKLILAWLKEGYKHASH